MISCAPEVAHEQPIDGLEVEGEALVAVVLGVVAGQLEAVERRAARERSSFAALPTLGIQFPDGDGQEAVFTEPVVAVEVLGGS